MTTIRQLIQTGPAKANELFAKLGDTSDTAVKTRERLFTELKEELELLARLEEELTDIDSVPPWVRYYQPEEDNSNGEGT